MDAGFKDEAEYRRHRHLVNRRALIFLVAMSPLVLFLLYVFFAALAIFNAPTLF